MDDLDVLTSLSDASRARVARSIVSDELLGAVLRALPNGREVFEATKAHIMTSTADKGVDQAMLDALAERLATVEKKLR